MNLSNKDSKSIQLSGKGTIGDILIEEHEEGLWIETDKESYTVLNEQETNQLIDNLIKMRNKRFQNNK